MSPEPRCLRSFLSPVLWVLAVLCVLFISSCSDDDAADPDSGADAGTDGGADTDTGPFVCEVDPQRIFDDVAYLASEELAGRWPGTPGNEAALVWGETLFAELGLVPAGDDGTYRQAFDALVGPETTVVTYNILGALEGTDPELSDEVVVVGGHIDHLRTDEETGDVYLGADDNASGSAVTMELARLLSHCATPARTTVFALWNDEESGGVGSFFYTEHPTYPLDSTIAAYSVDMVGAGDGSGLVLYGAVDDANAWLAQVMEGSAVEMGLGWGVTAEPQFPASDHWPFSAAGVPAVWAISGLEWTHPNYHTPEDTIDGISLDTLEMSASMMYAGVKPLVEGTEQQYLADVDAGMGGG